MAVEVKMRRYQVELHLGYRLVQVAEHKDQLAVTLGWCQHRPHSNVTLHFECICSLLAAPGHFESTRSMWAASEHFEVWTAGAGNPGVGSFDALYNGAGVGSFEGGTWSICRGGAGVDSLEQGTWLIAGAGVPLVRLGVGLGGGLLSLRLSISIRVSAVQCLLGEGSPRRLSRPTWIGSS